MGRRRRSVGDALWGAAMRYYLEEPRQPEALDVAAALRHTAVAGPEHQRAWAAYQAALCDTTFAALCRAAIEDEAEEPATRCALKDRLRELGLEEQLDRVLGFIASAREDYQLPF